MLRDQRKFNGWAVDYTTIAKVPGTYGAFDGCLTGLYIYPGCEIMNVL